MSHRRLRWISCVLGMSVLTPMALAASAAAESGPSDLVPSGPTIPEHLLWPGIVVIVVIAVFVTAALAGPIIRANMQDEVGDSDSETHRSS